MKVIKKADKPPSAGSVAEASRRSPNQKPALMIRLVFCQCGFVPIVVREINEALDLRLGNALRPYLKGVTLRKFIGQDPSNILSHRLLVGPRCGAEVADTDGLYGIANKAGQCSMTLGVHLFLCSCFRWYSRLGSVVENDGRLATRSSDSEQQNEEMSFRVMRVLRRATPSNLSAALGGASVDVYPCPLCPRLRLQAAMAVILGFRRHPHLTPALAAASGSMALRAERKASFKGSCRGRSVAGGKARALCAASVLRRAGTAARASGPYCLSAMAACHCAPG